MPGGSNMVCAGPTSPAEKGRSMEQLLRTDEKKQIVTTLEGLAQQMGCLPQEPDRWRPTLILLHEAVEGMMALALWGKNGLNAMSDACAKEWIAAYERKDGRFPRPRLDSFANLYKKVKSDRMVTFVLSRPFKPTGTQNQSIKRLDDLWCECAHFLPRGWTLDTSGLRHVVEDCLDVMSFLAFDSGNVEWGDAAIERQVRELIEGIRRQAESQGRARG